MKPRISTLVLTLAAVGLSVSLLREQRRSGDLTAQVARLSGQQADLRSELQQATARAADLEKRAIALDSQLGSTKSRTTATEGRHAQLARELNETRSRLTEREQREVALLAELASLGQNATVPGTGATRPTVGASADDRRILELERQLTGLLTRALAAEPPAAESAQPAIHQVVRVGSQDAFVVLDYGTAHGARPSDIIRLRRGTSEVAQVQISDARPRFSVAQVLPATLKGQLQTGDFVVLEN